MALFHIKWLRRFVRRNTSPIPEDTAALWKKRLSLLYMVVAWQAFGVVAYMMYTGRNDWAKHYGFKSEMEAQISPGRQFAQMFNVEKGKIIRVSGFHVVEETDIEDINKSVEAVEMNKSAEAVEMNKSAEEVLELQEE